MVTADPQHVAFRLRELLGWADDILDSLCRDPRYESGMIALLGRLTGEEDVRRLRQLAWALREKLDVVATRVELSPPQKP